MPFYDLDDLVEAKAGMKIADIFAKKGEAAFRALEAQTLADLSKEIDAVVACGGGTPCREEAWDAIHCGDGFAVWLKPEDTRRLIARLIDGRSKRPLISGITTAEEMQAYYQSAMDKRTVHYSKADAVFDSSYLENESEIEASINKFVDLLRQHGK